MTSSFTDIRTALAVAVNTVPGLQAFAELPPQIHPPAALIELDRVEYHHTFDLTSAVWYFNITVVVSSNDTTAAQRQLDAYLSTTLVRDAVEDDPTLGGVVSDATVRGATGYQPYSVADGEYLGVRFQVEVQQ